MLRSVIALAALLGFLGTSFAVQAYGQEDSGTGEVAGECFAPTVLPPQPIYAAPILTPVPIPDNNVLGQTNCIAIPSHGGGSVGRLAVNVLVNHTYVGDLTVTLLHEGSTTATLLDRPGVPATAFGCAEDNIAAVFSDLAVDSAENMCLVTPFAVYGLVLPATSLSTFHLQDIGGSWIIRVADNASGDTGALAGWQLRPNFIGDVNCANAIDSVDALLVLQLVAGLTPSLPCQDLADVNVMDGISAVDATLVLQYVAGLIGNLPP